MLLLGGKAVFPSSGLFLLTVHGSKATCPLIKVPVHVRNSRYLLPISVKAFLRRVPVPE